MQVDLRPYCETSYADFMRRLLPTVEPRRILGVRTPVLRALGKQLTEEQREAFLNSLPHAYYDENLLHTLLIVPQRSFERALALTQAFLPYVDNWAVCDQLRPKAFGKEPARLKAEIDRWLCAQHPYTVRFGIKMLMNFYLADGFVLADAQRLAQLQNEDYYVKMMLAWYFATALAKQWELVFPLMRQWPGDRWVWGKAIQKACESRRLSQAQKMQLRSLTAAGR